VNKQPLLEYNNFKLKKSVKESIDSDGRLFVEGVIQRSNVKNQNGRVYPKPILEQAIENYIKNFVEIGNALGELDHADTTVVSLRNASHVIRKIWWEGDDVMGRIEILNTPSGNIAKELLIKEIPLGISSRALGSIQEINENTVEVQDDLELSCWDFVSNPSTHGAFLSPVSLNESINTNKDKFYNLNKVIKDILNNY